MLDTATAKSQNDVYPDIIIISTHRNCLMRRACSCPKPSFAMLTRLSMLQPVMMHLASDNIFMIVWHLHLTSFCSTHTVWFQFIVHPKDMLLLMPTSYVSFHQARNHGVNLTVGAGISVKFFYCCN